MKTIRLISLLIFLLLNGCCYFPPSSDDPITITNQSNEAIFVTFWYYNYDGNETMEHICGKCQPEESYVFRRYRHPDRSVAVQVYNLHEAERVFKYLPDEIQELPLTPLATYLFSLSQLEEHDWTFTYPPSEPWMQSGIERIE